MPSVQRPGNTGIVPPHMRDAIAANETKAALVAINKKGKVGTRSLTFKLGSKTVQTDEAVKALLAGKKVKATVVEFKSVRGSKMLGGQFYRARVRVKGIKVETLDSPRALVSFAKAQVLDFNKSVKSDS